MTRRIKIKGFKVDAKGRLVKQPTGNLPANIAQAKAADKRAIRPVPKTERKP